MVNLPLPTSLIKPNLIRTVFHVPTPEGAKEERPSLRQVSCLDDKFSMLGGDPLFQMLLLLVFVTAKTKLESSTEAWVDQSPCFFSNLQMFDFGEQLWE